MFTTRKIFQKDFRRRRWGSQHTRTSGQRHVSRFWGHLPRPQAHSGQTGFSAAACVRRPRSSHIVRGITHVVLCRINQLACLPGLCEVDTFATNGCPTQLQTKPCADVLINCCTTIKKAAPQYETVHKTHLGVGTVDGNRGKQVPILGEGKSKRSRGLGHNSR